MFKKLTRLLFGDPNQKELDRLQPLVDEINALEPQMKALGERNALPTVTAEIRERLASAMAGATERVRELEAELAAEPDEDERRVIRRLLEEAKDALDRDEREVLDEELPRAFAAVREAARLTTGLRAYDEQLIGGIVLHRNTIAEMKTGEGKTLVATLPLYLNALTGRGAHLVTPNDYLSKYGVQWMGPVYHLLGLSVGVIQSMGRDPSMSSFLFDPDHISEDDRYMHLRPVERAEAYQADITYGTNNEFGFDYLRDNMVHDLRQCVQRELYFAIVDEVDNILIDEARTPLIISTQIQETLQEYVRFARLVRKLGEDDYEVEEKGNAVTITESGLDIIESELGLVGEQSLYDEERAHLAQFLENALKARVLFQRDKDYVVQDDEVILVDQHTGRLMYGRRFSEGLHQAIEAKEGAKVQNESLTVASVTYQNFFRMYRRLAGMTGTAVTESEEFATIYDLEVTVIPTHRPIARLDHADVVYKTVDAKLDAVYDEIAECHAKGQPVLVGTLAIETSEKIARDLQKKHRIRPQVLNAREHEREAQIVAQAGKPGAVTIATNMAGRGVDILLGGNPEGLARETLRRRKRHLDQLEPGEWEQALAEAEEQCEVDKEIVLAAGGLHVLGTERYESRRIDNQLRGRAGRQGDAGSSRFYVALEDELMQRFGGQAVAGLMDRFGVDEDIPIEANVVSRALENAQGRVEGHNFDMRKHLLEYDDVVNQQRQVIYEQRRMILAEDGLEAIVMDIIERYLSRMVEAHMASEEDDWHPQVLLVYALRILRGDKELAQFDPKQWLDMDADAITAQLVEVARRVYGERAEALDQEANPALPIGWVQFQRSLMLNTIDRHWIRHLTMLDDLREGIGLRAVAQQTPLVEYKREAYEAFANLMDSIEANIAATILVVSPRGSARSSSRVVLGDEAGRNQARGGRGSRRAKARSSEGAVKIGRNSKCPCGSGRKFKDCCMKEGLSPAQALAKGKREQKEAAGE